MELEIFSKSLEGPYIFIIFLDLPPDGRYTITYEKGREIDMKINEVEKIIGITKKNIRFYEEQGLLSPGRNMENGYRNYSDDDVERLRQIKILRKLGLPIEEIRSMQKGNSTVADCMKRHGITLERQQQNLLKCQDLCRLLSEEDVLLSDLDTRSILERMEEMEKSGTSFNNIINKDIKPIRYAGAIAASAIMTALMTALFLFMLWAFKTDPAEAPPLPFLIIFLAIPVIIVVGIIFSLVQRIYEIKRGEIDDAKKF